MKAPRLAEDLATLEAELKSGTLDLIKFAEKHFADEFSFTACALMASASLCSREAWLGAVEVTKRQFWGDDE